MKNFLNEYKISVVVPVLNEERCLPTLLSSLENQSSQNFDVVLVDGGSTDETYNIIERFVKRQILHITVVIDKTRNMGYVRNIGASHASSPILLHTNSDAYLPHHLIRDIRREFYIDNQLVCLSGRTFPLESTVFSHFAYSAFDLLRWLFIKLKYPVRKISPSGNFIAMKTSVFKTLNGFPERRVNEDGELGKKLTHYCASTKTHAKFVLSLWTGHYARRFQQGSLKTIRFYLYVLGNFSTRLQSLFAPIEAQSAEKFSAR